MRIAVTGSTGFLGRYIVNDLLTAGHGVRSWFRRGSDRGGFVDGPHEWIEGALGDDESNRALVEGTDAVVHAALYRPGRTFRGGEGDLVEFVRANVLGTIQLIEAARGAGVARFVFISTCAVHEVILDDRPLDEAHPLWPRSHYGAHKAAIEKFVHAYGLRDGFEICALRPTGIYGPARPIERSKWFDIVRTVADGRDVTASRGGKEVHATDVARSVRILLDAPTVAGQAYNCYDQYISEHQVAMIARRISGSGSTISGTTPQPKHQIETAKLRALGMTFGGQKLLEQTVTALLERVDGTKDK